MIKTLQTWQESAKNFEDFVEPSDEVDEEMYNYFRDILPPIRIDGGFQVPESFSDALNENGKPNPIYSTFSTNKGRFFFVGYCFLNSTTPQKSIW